MSNQIIENKWNQRFEKEKRTETTQGVDTVNNFTHLHLHTDYSMMDGCQKMDVMFKRLKELGMKKVAITNHGNMINMPKLIMEGEKEGIQVIPGCELYVCWDYPATIKDKDHKKVFHMVVLAKNMKGYKNLIKLTSRGYLEGKYHKPRVDRSMLEEHSEGMIALTACLNGNLANKIAKQGVCPFDLGEDVQWLKETYGENVYLEIQRHPEQAGAEPEYDKEGQVKPTLCELQDKANAGIIGLSKKYDVPLVATCDSHYAVKEHFDGWQSMMLLQTNFAFGHNASNDYYIKSADQMHALYTDMPEVVNRSYEIAEACEPITFDCSIKYPPVDTGGLDVDQFLLNTCSKGLEERIAKGQIPGEKREEYEKRLHYECEVLAQKNFSGYILLVSDYTTWAKNQGILMAPGRGSGCGSLVCYLTRTTEVDPIKYGLIFERFINPERDSFPDIDQDFQDNRRLEVKDYIIEKNGEENVCSIMTLGTLAAKGALREMCRRYKLPFVETNEFAKLIPPPIRGRSTTLEDAYKIEPRFKDMVNKNPVNRKIYDTALIIEGMTKSTGTHAAGVIVSNGTPLIEDIGIMVDKEGNRTSVDDMKVLEKRGFIKLDLLGLRTMTIIDETAKWIYKNHGIVVDIYDVNLEDSEVFSMIREGNLFGVFQLGGSTGFIDVTTMMAPETIENLSDINAVYRPGPLDNNFHTKYAENKALIAAGKQIEYMMTVDNPEVQKKIEEILKPTYGVCLYQEQIQYIAQRVAGYSLGGADILRRVMGKKIKSEMEENRVLFVKGCIDNGVGEVSANTLFDQIAKFADYGFNKSHSIAYSIVSYWTAWLKFYYPYEFMAANLSVVQGDQDRTIELINACKDEEIKILPPEINSSELDYTPLLDGIRFGLGAIKGVGTTAINPLIEERNESGKYKSYTDFIRRSNLSKIKKSDISCLIKAGCFNNVNVA
jgi:DNA polymerase-3 subunit alpha